MTERDYLIAQKLKEKLSKIVELLDVRVFGSRAKGSADEYSDMDVFIEVLSLDKDQKEKIFDITWEIGFDNFMVISPLLFTKDELEKSPLRSSPIVRNIMHEGLRI